MTVSVIVPTFNRRFMVMEAVASVLAQERVRMETIVVDDGSTDGTGEALKSLAGDVRYVFQPNAGVSAARNLGLKLSSGEWVAFLDSDDLWLPGKLAAQLDFFRKNPAFGICQTEELWVRGGRRVNPRKYHGKPRGYCFSRLLERCLVSPSAVMLRRELLEEAGGFDEALPACEDYDLWLRLGCRHPVGLVEEPLVVKRGGRGDQLSACVPALDRYRIRALEKLLDGGELSPSQRRGALEALASKCRIYGEGCLKRGRVEEGRRVLSLPRRPGESGVE